jgi:MFS family permease
MNVYGWRRRTSGAPLSMDGRAWMPKGVIGTAAVFAASGAAQASWLSRLPALGTPLEMTLDGIGFALFFVGLGWLFAMPLSGRLCTWFGMRRVIVTSAVLACGSVGLLGAVGTQAALNVALLAFGLAGGVWDAGMNVHGSTVERRGIRPRMLVFHGYWSVGASIGAAAGALAEHARVGVAIHLAGAALVCAVVCVVAGLDLLAGAPDPGAPGASAIGHGPAPTPWGTLVRISVLLTCAAIVEGAASEWVPTLFAMERRASAAMGASVYAVMAAAMALSRFLAVRIQQRWGRVATVRYGALTAAAGILLMLSASGGPFAYVGALLWGLGIAPAFPAAVSASGEGARPADLVAVTTAVGYMASLVGPPAIGGVAEVFGLGTVLFGLPLLAVIASLLAPAVGPGAGPAR